MSLRDPITTAGLDLINTRWAQLPDDLFEKTRALGTPVAWLIDTAGNKVHFEKTGYNTTVTKPSMSYRIRFSNGSATVGRELYLHVAWPASTAANRTTAKVCFDHIKASGVTVSQCERNASPPPPNAN